MNIVDQMGRHLSLSLVLFVFHCCSAPPGGESDGSEEMADGVDHIDIYADVEEEFNQVINPHSVYFDNYANCSAFAYCFAAIVTTEEDRSLLVKQAHLPYRPRFTMLQLHLNQHKRPAVLYLWCCGHLKFRLLYVLFSMQLWFNILFPMLKAVSFIVQRLEFRASAWPFVAGWLAKQTQLT